MKGDFSRQTFRRVKHYAGVLMQQGRVAVDADWNEQQSIARYRVETETKDVIGLCGTPLDPPAFTSASGFAVGLTGSGKDITIGAGRFYVDGLLCENEATFDYDKQGQRELPAPPSVLSLLTKEGDVGLVYLDAWQRHVTKLDDSELQEQALGDVDTTTRIRTTWQVRVLPWPSPPTPLFCESPFPAWDKLKARASGTLTAKAVRPTTPPSPCETPPSAGFTRLENQLYRVEVHKGTETAGPATFKWSRENGSILTSVSKFETGNWLTVESVGRDETLGFAEGQWVELVNDKTELDAEGKRLGQLLKVARVDEGVSRIRLDPTKTIDPALNDLDLHPKLRRWDQADRPAPDSVTVNADGTLTIQNGVEVPLEDGVRVRFDGTTWNAGDYWLIPARTATGDVEWPRNGTPLPQPPAGVAHHLCKLGIVRRIAGDKLELVSDCRAKFPPLTELTSLVYLGGDGQEVMPAEARNSSDLVALPEPLRVGVIRGGNPVPGATVRFTLLDGSGQVNGKTPFDELPTDAQGIATCTWQIASNLARQHVEATLRENGAAAAVPIVFSATRSIAEQVRYFPPSECPVLAPAHEVQTAIDRLAAQTRLYDVSGNYQEVMPADASALEPLKVRVANDCGPVKGAEIAFVVIDGGGAVNPKKVVTGADGVAQTAWTLGATAVRQHVEARLVQLPNGVRSIDPSVDTVEFVANLSTAAQVAYAPGACADLADAATVQEALDKLCKRPTGGSCCVVVEPGAQLDEVLKELVAKNEPNICLCLKPGGYTLGAIDITSPVESIAIAGCGPGVRIKVDGLVRMRGLNALVLRDLELLLVSDKPEDNLLFESCESVTIEGCRFRRMTAEGLICEIADQKATSREIRISSCTFQPFRTVREQDAVGPLRELLMLDDRREFSLRWDRFADRLASDAALRQELAQAITDTGPSPDQSEGVQEAYRLLLAALQPPEPAKRDIGDALDRVRQTVKGAALPALLALTIDKVMQDARWIIESSEIEGVLVLYGTRPAPMPSDPVFKKLRGRAKSLSGSSSLHLRDVRIGRVAVTKEKIDDVLTGKGAIADLGHLQVAGAEVTAAGSLFLAMDVTVGSTDFLLGPVVGAVVAKSAIVYGDRNADAKATIKVAAEDIGQGANTLLTVDAV